MASKKVQAALLKQKEAKQKKILFLLVPVFIGLLAWQGPKTFKALTGGSPPPPPPAAAPATTTTTAAPTPGSAPSTPGAGAAVNPGVLVDTDAPLDTLDGQLDAFSVFPGRDPFAGGPTPVGSASTDSTGTNATPTSAVLAINGAQETVAVAGTFPKSDPVFKLVGITAGEVTIALVSGNKFTDGSESQVIKLGATLTVAGNDGSSFVIKFVSAGTS
jgi:hypothetical protein